MEHGIISTPAFQGSDHRIPLEVVLQACKSVHKAPSRCSCHRNDTNQACEHGILTKYASKKHNNKVSRQSLGSSTDYQSTTHITPSLGNTTPSMHQCIYTNTRRMRNLQGSASQHYFATQYYACKSHLLFD